MTAQQVRQQLKAVQDTAETLKGEGYHTALHAPTQAALDVRFLLAMIDSMEPKLEAKMERFAKRVDLATHVISAWLICANYRSIQHRHDGSYRAIDEATKDEFNAGDAVALAEMLDPSVMNP